MIDLRRSYKRPTDQDRVFLEKIDLKRILEAYQRGFLDSSLSTYKIKKLRQVKAMPPFYSDEDAEEVVKYLASHVGEEVLCLQFNRVLQRQTGKDATKMFVRDVYDGVSWLSQEIGKIQNGQRPVVVKSEVSVATLNFLNGVLIEQLVPEKEDISSLIEYEKDAISK
jgi:hypothetical protein